MVHLNQSPTVVVVAGAEAAGTLTALHVVRAARCRASPLSIVLLEPAGESEMTLILFEVLEPLGCASTVEPDRCLFGHEPRDRLIRRWDVDPAAELAVVGRH